MPVVPDVRLRALLELAGAPGIDPRVAARLRSVAALVVLAQLLAAGRGATGLPASSPAPRRPPARRPRELRLARGSQSGRRPRG